MIHGAGKWEVILTVRILVSIELGIPTGFQENFRCSQPHRLILPPQRPHNEGYSNDPCYNNEI